MAGLIELKRRMSNVVSIAKITNVMYMVSAAQFNRNRNTLHRVKDGFTTAEEIFRNVLNNINNNALTQIYLNNNNTKSALIIVIGSDRGFCGNINSGVIKKTNSFLKELNSKHGNITILPVGNKVTELLKRLKAKNNQYNILSTGYLTEKSYQDTSIKIKRDILNASQKEFNAVYIIYPEFKTPSLNLFTAEQILPLTESQSHTNRQSFDVIESEEIIHNTLDTYISHKILHSMLSSNTAITSARMQAMDNATKNGNELMGELKITYNKTRQAVITNELSDLISGSEAVA